MKVLTFDIGGANIKRLLLDSETGEIKSEVHYFPLWQNKEEFPAFLQGLNEDADRVGITMTAELSDVFASKKEGVRHIIGVCEDVFDAPVYLALDGALHKTKDIKSPPDLAAANWIASIYYLEREFKEGILVDCGSTTTDVIPFRSGEVFYKRTDLERLKSGQLVYTGILRTPVNAIVDVVPLDDEMVGISSEYFAITADIYNVLGVIDTDGYSCETPDGKSRGRAESMQRISRLLCADPGEVGEKAIVNICEYVHERQVERIAAALKRHGQKDAYICGVGKILAGGACARAGLRAVDLSVVTPAHDNLPCLGLAHMLSNTFRVVKL